MVLIWHLYISDEFFRIIQNISDKFMKCFLLHKKKIKLLENCTFWYIPTEIHLFKRNKGNTRAMSEIYSKLTGVFIVNFEHISLIILFPLLALNLKFTKIIESVHFFLGIIFLKLHPWWLILICVFLNLNRPNKSSSVSCCLDLLLIYY